MTAPTVAMYPPHSGEIIVRYHNDLPNTVHRDRAQALAARGGPGQMVRALSARPAVVLRPERPEDFDTLLAHYRSDPSVWYAEPNYRVQRLGSAALPNDPVFIDPPAGIWWVCSAISDGMCTSRELADTRVAYAWQRLAQDTTPLTPIRVAVIDGGIDPGHEDLHAVVSPLSRRFITCSDQDARCQNTPEDDVSDDDGHGTHVAGIIAAIHDNARGLAGIAPAVELLVLKAFDGDGASIADIVDAIDYAVEHGARVINASYGYTQGPSRLEREALERARAHGALVVAAAGNGSTAGNRVDNDRSPLYPASYPLDNILGVAASVRSGALAVYTHVGRNTVQLAAPGGGEGITQLAEPAEPGIHSTLPGNHYGVKAGTSMATAMVSGAAALYLSARGPEPVDHRALRERIVQTTVQDPNLVPYLTAGGRLDVDALLDPGLTVSLPMRPTHLRAHLLPHAVRLQWLDNSVINLGYAVERRPPDAEGWELLDDSLPPGAVEFDDEQAVRQGGGLYQYRVRALPPTPAGGDCCASTVATVLIPANGGHGGQCLIATAAYGTPLAAEVQSLRNLRDRVLLRHHWGRALIRTYERLSPPAAAFIAERPRLRALVRVALRPLVAIARRAVD